MLQLYSLNGVWLSGSSQLLGARSHPDAVSKIKAKASIFMQWLGCITLAFFPLQLRTLLPKLSYEEHKQPDTRERQ